MLNHSKLDRSNSLYKVKLQTSSAYGSDLTDINFEVLLCLIDENGNSILQRISTGLENAHSMQSQGSDLLHFQRASVDEFIFEGPKLGKIAAVWISPESCQYFQLSQWRLGVLSITVISLLSSVSVGNEKSLSDCTAVQYDFDIEDVLLGEKIDSSMMEFRPCSVTKFSEDNIMSLSEKTLPSSSLGTQNMSNEDTMKEYADLKLSLLLYDVILTVAGSSVAFSDGEKSAIAFLTGGIGGFLYLLLVQRSVDGIPSSELTKSNRTETLDQTNKGFKGSVLSIVLTLAVTTVAANYALGDVARVFTPQDFMLGTFGFLLSKSTETTGAEAGLEEEGRKKATGKTRTSPTVKADIETFNGFNPLVENSLKQMIQVAFNRAEMEQSSRANGAIIQDVQGIETEANKDAATETCGSNYSS
ncbi:hypothetical protein K7X08_007729 [Anisodus acutangulus]|uniref:DUF7755 domain-containing protein n=1 Tax=Anisodus acutangulus TaxID=402998 RepID=A0A9Q1MSC5_9SOLA|nr:hypothetical protein K7X08_007729 [Anisodus acutangulus]